MIKSAIKVVLGIAIMPMPMQVPLIRAPNVPPEVFAARLAAQPEALALVERLETTLPLEADSHRLSAAFARAQSLFLDGSTDASEKAFRDVTRLASEADWRDAQRAAISFSFLRLAQLAASALAGTEKIEAAVAFAPDLRPDADAFPPPLVAGWNKALAEVKARSTAIEVFEKFPGYDLLKIDGRAFAIRPGLVAEIAPGPHRVSLLSNSMPYFSQILTAAQLKVLRVDQPSFVGGDCENPSFAGYAELGVATVRVIFAECAKTFGANGWVVETEAPAKPSLARAPEPVMAGPGAPGWIKTEGQDVKPRTPKWFWIALTAVAAASIGLLVYQAQNNANTGSGGGGPQPSRRDGL